MAGTSSRTVAQIMRYLSEGKGFDRILNKVNRYRFIEHNVYWFFLFKYIFLDNPVIVIFFFLFLLFHYIQWVGSSQNSPFLIPFSCYWLPLFFGIKLLFYWIFAVWLILGMLHLNFVSTEIKHIKIMLSKLLLQHPGFVYRWR